MDCRHSLNWVSIKAGPLSDTRHFGMPNRLKILRSIVFTVTEVIFVVGNFEKASTATKNKYCATEKNPHELFPMILMKILPIF